MPAVTPVRVSRRRTAAQWRQLCDVYDDSRLTRKQFCQQHSLALSTFDYWRNKLKKQNTARDEQEPLFIELTDSGGDHGDPSGSEPVASASSSWAIELQLGDHIILRLRDAC